jgi:hypothetical protein
VNFAIRKGCDRKSRRIHSLDDVGFSQLPDMSFDFPALHIKEYLRRDHLVLEAIRSGVTPVHVNEENRRLAAILSRHRLENRLDLLAWDRLKAFGAVSFLDT